MAKGLGDKLVLAISSRALFDLSESHKVYPWVDRNRWQPNAAR